MDASGFDDERVVLRFRPSLKACCATPGGWLLLLASALVVGLPFLAARLARDGARRYVLTNRRLEVTSGWIMRRRDAVELAAVSSVTRHATALAARLGLGDIALTVEKRDAPIWLAGIAQAEQVADTLRATVMLARLTRGVDDSAPPNP